LNRKFGVFYYLIKMKPTILKEFLKQRNMIMANNPERILIEQQLPQKNTYK